MARAIALLVCLVVGGGAQSGFTDFEVATVKRAAPDAIGRWMRMQTTHQFVAHNQSLQYLIAGVQIGFHNHNGEKSAGRRARFFSMRPRPTKGPSASLAAYN